MSCHSLKKNKLAKDLTGDEWTVMVGSGASRQTFQIHRQLLERCTAFFDNHKLFDPLAAENRLIFLHDEDPDAFRMFRAWAYSGEVAKAKTVIPIKSMPTEAELKGLEVELRLEFNSHMCKLVSLYCLGEKYEINDLCNRTIDTIQDGFLEYGSVFGPGLAARIFANTKKESKLRDLCVGSVILHMDRDCTQLRNEIMLLCITEPGYLNHMLKWIARNFTMFGRREREGFDIEKWDTGFSMLNRAKLCSCHLHEHAPGQAHRGHDGCAVKFFDCSQPGDDDRDRDSDATMLGALMGATMQAEH